MAFPNDRTYTFDANNGLSDNAAPYTASGYMQYGGQDGVVDLGGNQGTSPVQQARIDAMAIFDVTALNIATADETYSIDLLLSNDPAFGAGAVVNAGSVQLRAANIGRGVNAFASVIGRYEIGFTNQVAGNIYQYAKAYLAVVGTGPSISIFAFIAVLPES